MRLEEQNQTLPPARITERVAARARDPFEGRLEELVLGETQLPIVEDAGPHEAGPEPEAGAGRGWRLREGGRLGVVQAEDQQPRCCGIDRLWV